MESSILTSTKRVLNLAEDYTAFDEQILQFINGALSDAEQVGVVFTSLVFIEDKTTNWADLGVDALNLMRLKNYIYLKARQLFDPPSTSFALEAMDKQIEEI